jgi:hypothetical protein
MKILVSLSLLASTLSGCAGTITAVSNMPITSDHLEGEPFGEKLKTVSGDRRLVRVYKSKQTLICAETQADAISARSGKGTLSIEARGSFSDEAGEALTATYARTELSDVVRQLSWQICNGRMNGSLTDEQYRAQMASLQEKTFEVLRDRALASVPKPEQPPKPQETCTPAKDKPCPAKAGG